MKSDLLVIFASDDRYTTASQDMKTNKMIGYRQQRALAGTWGVKGLQQVPPSWCTIATTGVAMPSQCGTVRTTQRK